MTKQKNRLSHPYLQVCILLVLLCFFVANCKRERERDVPSHLVMNSVEDKDDQFNQFNSIQSDQGRRPSLSNLLTHYFSDIAQYTILRLTFTRFAFLLFYEVSFCFFSK